MGHSHRSVLQRAMFALSIAALCVIFTGCGKQQRTVQQIDQERRALPALYITQASRTEVMAPRNKGIFVHEPTGELAYPAYACQNPDCPGRMGDQPHLFIHVDPALSPGADGEIVRGPPAVSGHPAPVCPACLGQRDTDNETLQEKTQYMLWAEPYLPPESAARAAELEEEYQQVFSQTRRRVDSE